MRPIRFPFWFCVPILFSLSTERLYGGDFGEHKYIGDKALKQFLNSNEGVKQIFVELLGYDILAEGDPRIPLTSRDSQFYSHTDYVGLLPILFRKEGEKEYAVTYGDLSALAGDHSPNYMDLTARFEKGEISDPELYTKLFADFENQYRCELADLDAGGRGFNPIHFEFIDLAQDDRSHFLIPAASLRQQFDRITAEEIDLYRIVLGGADRAKEQLTLSLFNVNAIAKYCLLQTIAKRLFRQVLEQRILDRVRARRFLVLAVFASAFSAHYLQDMFAGGHYFVDRNAPFDLLGLEARGRHDYYSRTGIESSAQRKPIRLFGDGRFTEAQLEAAVNANVESLRDVFDTTQLLLHMDKPITDVVLLRRNPSQDPVTVFPALGLTPRIPIGREFDRQQRLGKSVSGFAFGAYAFGSNRSAGVGLFSELHLLVIRPKDTSLFESYFGLSLGRVLAEVKTVRPLAIANGVDVRFGLGTAVSFFDWIYANISVLGEVNKKVGARIEEGLQLKFFSWNYGVRLGLVHHTNALHGGTQLCLSLIHF